MLQFELMKISESFWRWRQNLRASASATKASEKGLASASTSRLHIPRTQQECGGEHFLIRLWRRNFALEAPPSRPD